MVFLRLSVLALCFTLLFENTMSAQPAQVLVQRIQNENVRNGTRTTFVGEVDKGAPADLGITFTTVTVSRGESLDKILLKNGIQPDAFSRRMVVDMNPSLDSAHDVSVGADLRVPDAEEYLTKGAAERDLGTKVRLREERFADKVEISNAIKQSQFAADKLLRQGGHDQAFIEDLHKMKEASKGLSLVKGDIVLTDREAQAITFANRILEAPDTMEIPASILPLVQRDAAATATAYYRVAHVRSTDSSSARFDVKVRTCSASSCENRWDPTKSCQDNQDRCGLKVCYLVSGDYLMQSIPYRKEHDGSTRGLMPECKSFSGASSPADDHLDDAPYMVWAVSQDQDRVSCIEDLEVSQDRVWDGVVFKEFSAEVQPAAIGTPTCK